MQASSAFVPQTDFEVQVPKDGKTATAYIFYPANLLPQRVRFDVPDWKHGGIVREGALTLKYRNGYIRQCEITQMRQQMESVAANFVHPAERRHMTKTYNIVEEGSKKAIGLDDNLYRMAFYPQDEIEVLTSQGDGIVKMPVSTSFERDYAQQFLFPNWDEPDFVLPTRISDIKAHLQGRLKEAKGETVLINVCNAAIMACDLFDQWGRRIINEQNAIYEEARAKGWAWSYGADAELCFEQLNIQRKDNLVQEQANRLDQLTEALTRQAEAIASNMGRQALPTPAPAAAPAKNAAIEKEVDGNTGA